MVNQIAAAARHTRPAGLMTRLRENAVRNHEPAPESAEDAQSQVLCTSDQWVRSGKMMKQFIPTKRESRQGADSSGAWLPRFAVLSDRTLAFTKGARDNNVIDYIPLNEITAVETEEVALDVGLGQSANLGSPSSHRHLQPSKGDVSKSSRPSIPTGEVRHQLIIDTQPDGHNSGRQVGDCLAATRCAAPADHTALPK